MVVLSAPTSTPRYGRSRLTSLHSCSGTDSNNNGTNMSTVTLARLTGEPHHFCCPSTLLQRLHQFAALRRLPGFVHPLQHDERPSLAGHATGEIYLQTKTGRTAKVCHYLAPCDELPVFASFFFFGCVFGSCREHHRHLLSWSVDREWQTGYGQCSGYGLLTVQSK